MGRSGEGKKRLDETEWDILALMVGVWTSNQPQWRVGGFACRAQARNGQVPTIRVCRMKSAVGGRVTDFLQNGDAVEP